MNTEPTTDPAPLSGPMPLPDDFAGLEDIRGPIFGYHVAAYTIEREEGVYAFAKICRERPESVWETPDARAIVSAGPRGDAQAVLEDVFKVVHQRLSASPASIPLTAAPGTSLRIHAHIASTCSCSPCSSASTEPSAWLRTQPVMPSSRAFCTQDQR